MQRSNPEIPFPDLYEATISELQDGLESGRFKSIHLVKVRRCLSSVSYSVMVAGILGENRGSKSEGRSSSCGFRHQRYRYPSS